MCAQAAPPAAREPWLPRRALVVGVAACYAVAFASLHAQLPGLLGRDGLLPITPLLPSAEARAGGRSAPLAAKLHALPTLLWLHRPLHTSPDCLAGAFCLLGCAVAGGVAAGAALRRTPGGLHLSCALVLLHVLYASLLAVGQAFLSFQWDILLLECSALAALLAAPRTLPTSLAWAPRLALFKLMLASGAVKVQSRCPTWSQLSALEYHFATQPLPTPLAWHASALPRGLLRLSVAAALAAEGPAAWLLLCPLRGARGAGVALQMLFQLSICASGNYTFFNALTCVLALACLSPPPSTPAACWERTASGILVLAIAAACCAGFRAGPPGSRLDGLRLAVSADGVTAALAAALPATMRALFCVALPVTTLQSMRSIAATRLRVLAALCWGIAAASLCALTAAPLAALLPADAAQAFLATLPPLPPQLRSLAAAAHVSSSYGLFRAMTGVGNDGRVARPELQMQGRNASAAASADAAAGWTDIPFRFKPSPGEPQLAPRWVAPHQPRLDWQMWFAALGPPGPAPWAIHLAAHALRGTPDVWALLRPPASGGFSAAAPPAEVRILAWELSFTQRGSAAAARGDWWAVAAPQVWLPPLRGGPNLDAWLAARGWAPPKGKRRGGRSGRFAWARGGQAWAGAAAAAAGAAAAAAAVRAPRRRGAPHHKRE
jgi:hypothetical protein